MAISPNTIIGDCLVTAFKLDRYFEIIDEVKKDDFRATSEFKNMYIGFWGMGWRSAKWYDKYFTLLEQQRIEAKSFEQILRALHDVKPTIEVSFASKLIATVDPSKPIWDSIVIHNLGFEEEWEEYRTHNHEERISKAVEIYEKMIVWYSGFLQSDEGKECVCRFNEAIAHYPNKLSDVKKVDYMLWGMR